MYFSDFLIFCEGSKNKYKQDLGAVMDYARAVHQQSTEIESRPKQYDSIKSLKKHSGHSAIKKAQKRSNSDYESRKTEGVKRILKMVKDQKKNKKNLKEAPSDWLKAQHAKEAEQERKRKAEKLKKKELQAQTVSHKEIKIPMPNAGKKTYLSKSVKDKYTVDTYAPKNKEYKF